MEVNEDKEYGESKGTEQKCTTFFSLVHTGSGAHPASCTMGTGSLSRRYIGREVSLTTHPHLAPRLKKE
jgi:hypothetical protein